MQHDRVPVTAVPVLKLRDDSARSMSKGRTSMLPPVELFHEGRVHPFPDLEPTQTHVCVSEGNNGAGLMGRSLGRRNRFDLGWNFYLYLILSHLNDSRVHCNSTQELNPKPILQCKLYVPRDKLLIAKLPGELNRIKTARTRIRKLPHLPRQLVDDLGSGQLGPSTDGRCFLT